MDNSRELLTNILGGKKHLTREDIIPFYQKIDIDNAHTVRHLLAVAEAEGIIHNGCTDGRKITYRLYGKDENKFGCLPKEEALARLATKYFQSPRHTRRFCMVERITGERMPHRNGTDILCADRKNDKRYGIFPARE